MYKQDPTHSNGRAYKYNAHDGDMDAWNANFTSRFGDGAGDPEEQYFSLLELVTQCRPSARLLDIGCGLGRVISLVKDNVQSIVGLEPDRARFSECHAAHHNGDSLEILNCTSTEFKTVHPDRKFDIIIVSMVIQHVSTDTCAQILRDVHELLSTDGVAIIATTQQDTERFTFARSQSDKSREEYDRYAEDCNNQTWGIPVRQFSRTSFLAALQEAGFRAIHWGQFSYIRPERLKAFAQMMQRPAEAIADVATSQYAVIKK
jgi:cyclopropane fatty-acyl-phospholipid synthase-like methyltransferase